MTPIAQITNDVVRSFGLDKVNIGTTGRLAMYETSCLDIGEELIKTLFSQAARAAMDTGLDRFKSQGEFKCHRFCHLYIRSLTIGDRNFRSVKHVLGILYFGSTSFYVL